MEIDKIYNIDCEKGMALLSEGYNYCIVTDRHLILAITIINIGTKWKKLNITNGLRKL